MRVSLFALSVFIFTGLSGCQDVALSPDASPQEIDRVISEGLEAWRKPGAIQKGAACANCHAPDAIDLAYFDFSESTIKRRAEPHVGHFSFQLTGSDFKKIQKMIQALRVKYDIEPRDHMKFRPLQPGGEVLPGNTAAERDKSYALQLFELGYPFVTDTVLTLEDARMHRDAWLDVNPRTLKIG